MRRYLVIPVLALYSLVAGAEQWERTYAVGGKPEVTVDADDADVEVAMASSRQATLRVITRGWKIDRDLRLSAEQSGNRIALRLRHRERACFFLCLESIRIEVRVPQEADLKVHSGNGNLQVEKVNGSFELETTDGNIRLEDSKGSLRARTHDGNIDVQGSFDLLDLTTGDGNVDAEVTAAAEPKSGWMIRSGDGNLRLRLPEDLGADLEARSGDGKVAVELPIATTGLREQNAVRGKIHGGGISIELSTGDGNIQVEKI